jgi:hypothetical protein
MDHVRNLKKIRETIRKQRRETVAKIASAKREPTTFKRLVDLQAAFDAVEWALEDEESLAKQGDQGSSSGT